MTTPHTAAPLGVERTAPDLAAIEARAAAARPDPSRIVVVNGVPSISIVEASFIMAALDDVPALLAHITALRAQHAADVAAAVAGERARAVAAVLARIVDADERSAATGTLPSVYARIIVEDCARAIDADAIAAPTGGGE